MNRVGTGTDPLYLSSLDECVLNAGHQWKDANIMSKVETFQHKIRFTGYKEVHLATPGWPIRQGWDNFQEPILVCKTPPHNIDNIQIVNSKQEVTCTKCKDMIGK